MLNLHVDKHVAEVDDSVVVAFMVVHVIRLEMVHRILKSKLTFFYEQFLFYEQPKNEHDEPNLLFCYTIFRGINNVDEKKSFWNL